MNAKSVTIRDYENKRWFLARQRQSQFKANFNSLPVPPVEVACSTADGVELVADSQQTTDNSKSQIGNQSGDLKKQSQFPGEQMSVTSFQVRDCGDFAAWRLPKYKTNSKPNKHNFETLPGSSAITLPVATWVVERMPCPVGPNRISLCAKYAGNFGSRQ
ncbi:MAG: hypothetical protein PVJ86_14880 [Phycisphaerales bacterium]|jgi:hypothetical protein